MAERRLPDPVNVTDDPQELDYYLQDLVRELGGLIDILERELELLQQTEQVDSTVMSTGGNIDRNASVVICDASASAMEVYLPDPTIVKDNLYYVKKINTNSNDVTVRALTSATIDKSTFQVLTGSNRPTIKVYSDGIEYWIV